MTKNIGYIDRALRLLAAFAILILLFTGSVSGVAAVVLGIVATTLILTSAAKFCPAYLPLRISTSKRE